MEGVEKIDETSCKFLLGLKGDNLPVGGVNRIDHVLRRTVVHCHREILGIMRYFVHCHDLAAHVYWLRQGDSSEKHVMHVVFHGLFRNQGRCFGNILPVRSLERLSGQGVACRAVLVAFGRYVESADRQMLVFTENGYFFLVIGVSSGEIDSGQIGGESLVFLVSGFFNGFSTHAKIFVV